jgi:hypothetical protein
MANRKGGLAEALHQRDQCRMRTGVQIPEAAASSEKAKKILSGLPKNFQI